MYTFKPSILAIRRQQTASLHPVRLAVTQLFNEM